MSKSVPDGWITTSSMGKPVLGTCFLPFKVPLRETVCKNLDPDKRFSPNMLMEMEPNINLVINIANTKRYYNPNEFLSRGIDHIHIACPGQRIPSFETLRRFFDIVDKFMNSASSKDKYIGVHCTHGINRTGYFICQYMIQKLNFNANDAIEAFHAARGHEIYRKHFVAELLKASSFSFHPPLPSRPCPPNRQRQNLNRVDFQQVFTYRSNQFGHRHYNNYYKDNRHKMKWQRNKQTENTNSS